MSDPHNTRSPSPPGPLPDPDFWKRKLLAFLHDPPAKPFDLWRHEEDAGRFQRQAGLLDEEFNRSFDAECDRTAAAADRFPFPGTASGLKSLFTGDSEWPFLHPLGCSKLKFDNPFPSSGVANTPFDTTQPGNHMYDRSGLAPELQDWASFFLHWRLWPDHAADTDPRASFIPADTRIPDHTIWNHMALTSALYAATRDGAAPAFLIMQFGPVQDFIAQARSCRDLLSGSYLLSWLTAHAIKAVTDAVGPDCVLMPSLRGLALFDALHREGLFERLAVQGKDDRKDSLWNRIRPDAQDLLTPNLPNRFVALVPDGRGESLAKAAAQAARDELRQIADHVWAWVETAADKAGCRDAAGWRRRWNAQIDAFLQVAWQVAPAEMSLDKALENFDRLPAAQKGAGNRVSPAQALHTLHRLATELIPRGHRDNRFFEDPAASPARLSNPAFAWASWYGVADAALANRRNTRDFAAWDGAPASKDARSGKEEIIGTPEFWDWLRTHGEPVFKDNDKPLGAANLLKRLWCHPDAGEVYLRARLGLGDNEYRRAVRFDDTREVATGNDNGGPYIAVLALDGDEMGKWLSGAKTPAFRDCLSKGARDYFEALARGAGGQRAAITAALDAPRPLFPSYHLQFSEALTNFSRFLARRVVESFLGQLVYSGGDDVLALLPADKALACAEALRRAFRGEALPQHIQDLEIVPGCPGFCRFRPPAGKRIFAVPGPAAEVSCGIAIGHYKAPLQSLVRQAQEAEKQAKRRTDQGGFHRAAFMVRLFKRSGEILHWGARWDAEALALYQDYCGLRRTDAVSSRFPYALAQFLEPYRLDSPESMDAEFRKTAREIILRELDHVCDRQGRNLRPEQRQELRDGADKYLACIETRGAGEPRPLSDFLGLFLAAAFIERSREED